MLARLRWLILGLLLLCIGLTALAIALNFVPASLQPPRVLAIEPVNGATDILPDSPITVTFSTAMDRAATEGAVSITPNITGNFVWQNDQTLVFTADPFLPISDTVTINISQEALSWLHRPVQNAADTRFTTISRPYVTASRPALDAQFTYLPDQITVTFSRPMDKNNLFDFLTIDPELENRSYEFNQNTMTIRGRFKPLTHYQITIPASASDSMYGIEMNRDYLWSFTTGLEYPNVSILNRSRVLKFSANQPLEIPVQLTNVSRLDSALYPIPQETFDEMAIAPFESWYKFQPASVPLKTQSDLTNARLDEYTHQSIALDALPPGTYYLRITTPEGVSDAQFLLIE